MATKKEIQKYVDRPWSYTVEQEDGYFIVYMKNRKIEKTLIYEGLGFPIKLNGIPMKKVFGEWCMDVNLEDLQRNVIQCLAYKKHSLTGEEIRFIRKYFGMTTTDFGKTFGVTHAAVSKWKSNQNSIPLTTDIYIRLFVLEKMKTKNEEFRRFYRTVTVENLSEQKNASEEHLLELNGNLKFPHSRIRRARC